MLWHDGWYLTDAVLQVIGYNNHGYHNNHIIISGSDNIDLGPGDFSPQSGVRSLGFAGIKFSARKRAEQPLIGTSSGPGEASKGRRSFNTNPF